MAYLRPHEWYEHEGWLEELVISKVRKDGLQNMRDTELDQLGELEFDQEHYKTCSCDYCHCYLTDENTEFDINAKLCDLDKHNKSCRYGCCHCLNHGCDLHQCERFVEIEKEEMESE